MNKPVSLLTLSIAFLVMTSPGYATDDDDGRAQDAIALNKVFAGNLKEAQLVPKGFTAAGKAKGDLNSDGIDDIAVILRRETALDNFDLPQFVILFKGGAANNFELWKQGEHHFTNSMSNQMSMNGISHFAIDKGVLTIASDFAMSMGGWSAGGCTQKWRNSKTGFELIGLTVNATNRQCGDCGTYIDTNFLSRKQIIKKISDDPENPKTTTRTTKAKEGPVSWEKFDYDKRCSAE